MFWSPSANRGVESLPGADELCLIPHFGQSLGGMALEHWGQGVQASSGILDHLHSWG